MDERDLRGTNIAFVGGSGGIGLAAAQAVARRGAAVLLVGRSEVRGAEALASLRAAGASDVAWTRADVSSIAGVAEAISAISAWRPQLHGLVHTASLSLFRGASAKEQALARSCVAFTTIPGLSQATV